MKNWGRHGDALEKVTLDAPLSNANPVGNPG